MCEDKNVLAVATSGSQRLAWDGTKEGARRAGDIHHEVALSSNVGSLDIGGRISIDRAQVGESGRLNRDLDGFSNPE